ncbi:MAG: HEAT repeat domain-containing protein [Cyanobacteria bacterium P01_A01_bin.84]
MINYFHYKFFTKIALKTLIYTQLLVLGITSPLLVNVNTVTAQQPTNSESQQINGYIQGLNTRDEDQRDRIIAALAKMGQSAVPQLTKALQNQNPRIRANAAIALGVIGKNATAAVPALKVALKDQNIAVRSRAMRALSLIDRKQVVPFLISELSSKNAWERYSATHALKTFRQDAVAAIPALIKVVKEDKDNSVRTGATTALGSIGRDAIVAVPTLLSSLKDENERVRYGSAYALGRIGDTFYDQVNQLSDQELKQIISYLETAKKTIRSSNHEFIEQAVSSINEPLKNLRKVSSSRRLQVFLQQINLKEVVNERNFKYPRERFSRNKIINSKLINSKLRTSNRENVSLSN